MLIQPLPFCLKQINSMLSPGYGNKGPQQPHFHNSLFLSLIRFFALTAFKCKKTALYVTKNKHPRNSAGMSLMGTFFIWFFLALRGLARGGPSLQFYSSILS
jgi:hypothetical protein